LKKALHIFLSIVLPTFQIVSAQYKVQGTVYDGTRTYPLEGVSVITTNGRGTATNASGFYSIDVLEKDSIWFSYLQKPTTKFPVSKITNVAQFDIALQIEVPILKEVIIKPRDYRMDSIQNRIDYEKAFNFRRPSFESMTSIGPMGAGIDVNELIRLFQFRKNQSSERFRERLLLNERDNFIDYRFNRGVVRRLTKLTGDDLERFMMLYRPSFTFTLYSSDYDFHEYIKLSYQKYSKQKTF
jgi:hypothetical protein